MSEFTEALQEAWEALVADGSEICNYRGANVNCIVNRLGEADPLGSLPQFSMTDTGSAESRAQHATLMIAEEDIDLADPPHDGETITDASNMRHRIQSVRFDGLCWVLNCESHP